MVSQRRQNLVSGAYRRNVPLFFSLPSIHMFRLQVQFWVHLHPRMPLFAIFPLRSRKRGLFIENMCDAFSKARRCSGLPHPHCGGCRPSLPSTNECLDRNHSTTLRSNLPTTVYCWLGYRRRVSGRQTAAHRSAKQTGKWPRLERTRARRMRSAQETAPATHPQRQHCWW